MCSLPAPIKGMCHHKAFQPVLFMVGSWKSQEQFPFPVLPPYRTSLLNNLYVFPKLVIDVTVFKWCCYDKVSKVDRLNYRNLVALVLEARGSK